MNEAAALLRAIGEHADDDTPRLVYADWLDEHGQPERAEYIRLQIAMGRQGEFTPEAGRMHGRALALYEPNEVAWRTEFEPFDAERMNVRYLRGFPETLSIEVPTVTDLEILQRIPTVWQLVLQYTLTEKMLGVPEVIWSDPASYQTFSQAREANRSRITELPDEAYELVANHQNLDVLYVFDIPVSASNLATLEQLPCWTIIRIFERHFDDATWQRFVNLRRERFEKLSPEQKRIGAIRSARFAHDIWPPSPDLPLKSFRLSNRMSNEELKVLTAIPELEEVNVSNVEEFTTESLRQFAPVSSLKKLRLERCPVDLSPVRLWPALEDLEVVQILMDKEDSTAGLEDRTNLRRLVMRECQVGGVTIRRLSELRQLRTLHLDLQPIHDRSCFAVLQGLTELEDLDLNGYIDDRTLKYFSPLRKLHTLNLKIWGTIVDGFRHLGGLTNLRTLRLDIGGAGVLGTGFRYLAGLSNLQLLHLSGDTINDAGIEHFTGMTKLRSLVVRGTAVTEACARALLDYIPDVTVILDRLVVKQQRESITFRRRWDDPAISVLVPAHWPNSPENAHNPDYIWLVEDGCECVEEHIYATAGAGEITLNWIRKPKGETAEHILRNQIEENHELGKNRLGDDAAKTVEVEPIVPLGEGVVSCQVRGDDRTHFFCAALADGVAAVLECKISTVRFAELRPVFMYVARSLRVGEEAKQGVGEEVTVAVSEL
jgi:uncharacterized protein (TIGR02996 family)